jgi:hypothetical protein
MKVVIKTNFSPAFTYETPAAGGPAAGGTAAPVSTVAKVKANVMNKILALLQPSIHAMDIPIVGTFDYVPNGEPSGWGLVVVAGVAGLALYGAYRVVKDNL